MILWLNPFAGISGDMMLAALLDLGASADGVREAVASTGLPGWELCVSRVDAGGIVATRAEVEVVDGTTSRPAAELLELIRRARPRRWVRWPRGPWAPLPRWKRACTVNRSIWCTCTRSAASTRSWTP